MWKASLRKGASRLLHDLGLCVRQRDDLGKSAVARLTDFPHETAGSRSLLTSNIEHLPTTAYVPPLLQLLCSFDTANAWGQN